METTQIKERILQMIGQELDQWLEKSSLITEGYEYETQFMHVTQKVSRIIFTQSMGELSRDRNKKNFRPVLEK